ncbi:MAG: hypothetical protein OXH76_16790 [Boseongicola sp.]|nr:hypothetical protein [Boseongicola sp.]MYH56670.1 hypothetical protein [Boseongicola sp. SB0675_bin_26]
MTLWDRIPGIALSMLREPRSTAAELFRLGVPREAAWLSFVLVIVLYVIAVERFLPMAEALVMPVPRLPPLLRAGLELCSELFLVWVLWKLGGALGGQGKFEQVLLMFVFVWMYFTVAIVLLPILAAFSFTLTGLVGMAFFIHWIWLFVSVMAEAHGFKSLWTSFVLFVLSWIALFLFSLLFSPLVVGVIGVGSSV